MFRRNRHHRTDFAELQPDVIGIRFRNVDLDKSINSRYKFRSFALYEGKVTRMSSCGFEEKEEHAGS
jgi:hypothetical protein